MPCPGVTIILRVGVAGGGGSQGGGGGPEGAAGGRALPDGTTKLSAQNVRAPLEAARVRPALCPPPRSP